LPAALLSFLTDASKKNRHVSARPTKQLDSYRLQALPMTEADIPKLHQLSISVGWPHRPEDWALAIDLGQGIFAADEIGRVVGSAMWFSAGDDLAVIGMVVITPRLQEHGAGRWMMEQILGEMGERDKVLNSTRAAFRLYLSLGFQPGLTVWQHQGHVVANPTVQPGARPMRASDETAIRALDTAAFSAERRALFDRLMTLSEGTVIEREGEIRGFALCRRFGRGHVIGPVVAGSQEDAVALIAPHVAAHAGTFVRVDTREAEGPLRDYLIASGIRFFDTVTSMSKGGERTRSSWAHTHALATHSFG
jgi:GNAT superfamily N-acetyltransferase